MFASGGSILVVNINIEIPDELHKRLKLSSTIDDKTLKEYVIEALSKRSKKDSGAFR